MLSIKACIKEVGVEGNAVPDGLRNLVLHHKLTENLMVVAWVLIKAWHIYDLQPWTFTRVCICF